MTDRIHDDEVDTSEPVVRELLREQCPELADQPLTYVQSSGTVNAMWRIHNEVDGDAVVRLPRTADWARSVDKEAALLPALADTRLGDVVALPTVRLVGVPSDSFGLSWLVLDWLDGVDVWAARDSLDSHRLADRVAQIVEVISGIDSVDAPDRRPGNRGGPLLPLLERLEGWLLDPKWAAAALVDVGAVRRSADESREVANEPVERCFVHGDLIPGNLLTTGGEINAVIDWGGAGYGDPAQDVGPAWSVLDHDSRQRFRTRLNVDDATWLRARANELEQAVGAVLYYTPRSHPLADVMARTLDRVLNDS